MRSFDGRGEARPLALAALLRAAPTRRPPSRRACVRSRLTRAPKTRARSRTTPFRPGNIHTTSLRVGNDRETGAGILASKPA
jgi:hypothetical protein